MFSQCSIFNLWLCRKRFLQAIPSSLVILLLSIFLYEHWTLQYVMLCSVEDATTNWIAGTAGFKHVILFCFFTILVFLFSLQIFHLFFFSILLLCLHLYHRMTNAWRSDKKFLIFYCVSRYSIVLRKRRSCFMQHWIVTMMILDGFFSLF